MSIKDKFYIPPSDRKYAAIGGILVVLCILVYRLSDGMSPIDNGNGSGSVDNVGMSKQTALDKKHEFYAVDGGKTELFEFDPNTADSTQLLRLGLLPWMVRNIYRYRAAGGIYRKPSDFARLYGLTKKQYETLMPYIRISDDYKPAADTYGKAELSEMSVQRDDKGLPRDTVKYPYKLRQGEYVYINSADTTQLKKIPGVGSYYANAILRYRERLGGFYSVSQLKEIEGLPESVSNYVKVDGASVRKIRINKLSYSQLRQHPYLNYYQARDIVDYRRLHGLLNSLSELKLLDSFTTDDIERLKHYVEF